MKTLYFVKMYNHSRNCSAMFNLSAEDEYKAVELLPQLPNYKVEVITPICKTTEDVFVEL